jgi:hypothetical protein
MALDDAPENSASLENLVDNLAAQNGHRLATRRTLNVLAMEFQRPAQATGK